jgi:UDP-N-acetylmuramoyl-L-alanyl-D-glutamate--2,6-diaminopimelate ligase
MKLVDLLQSMVANVDEAHLELDIAGITQDSCQVKPGMLFAAIRGTHVNGEQFIPAAIEQGATAILLEKRPVTKAYDIPFVSTPNTREALSILASRLHQPHPAHIAAVTGTDGKTSVADFYRQFQQLMDNPAASIGTIGTIIAQGENIEIDETTNTTPDPVALAQKLQELACKNIQHVCIEASSHGLDQFRLDGVQVNATAFTNIARDHLDYHHTFEEYFLAKARLFSDLLIPGGTAVINADDQMSGFLAHLMEDISADILTFGADGDELKLNSFTPTPTGQKVSLTLFDKEYTFDLALVGGFQIMNILAALGLIVGTGGDVQAAIAQIPNLKGVPGRLEHVASHANGAAIYVDYAHTPGALEKILETLRYHTVGKLAVVFGCGGDRDKGKRPLMGEVAERLADRVYITDDNPRSEDPAMIRSEILVQAPSAKEIGDRAEAITKAVSELQAGDVLVIAGKGHEHTQTIGNEVFEFSDTTTVQEAVEAL